ncbi:MAG: tRNA pseudouridine(55) synthase TruB [Aquificaceae bacterium]|nr:tRNA pseudouridine(55) synthase TruB [Aquificaceae bacterium]MCX7989281.1 tRNA pseudouridine(55) synthase TruB [Aquificaceae bacterium]MDW8032804.1 tRNA pseudouridine(55) synthase TruB [Aquificaceae bacterium]MDW8294980.1 tRNA pseudouridine(55) synthase TruB [Aquificaceae bacterium]
MLTGVLLVDKPKGMTSMEVVEGVKKRFSVKAGHAGTLDPIATGLLVLLVGEATKFSQFFTGLDKTYITRAKLGEITQTYDAEGEVVEKRQVEVSCEDVGRVLKKFRGRIAHTPPPFSAKWVKGKRAYQLARRGLRVDVEPVEVEVYRAELLYCHLPQVELFFEVSSGTYIRSLVQELGLELLCGAHVVELRRLSVGPFRVDMAVSYERLLSLQTLEGLLLPLGEALSFLPRVNLQEELSRRIKRGAFIRLKKPTEKTFVRLYEGDRFLGVGLIEGENLRPYRLMQGL